jgi:hypothetical protein
MMKKIDSSARHGGARRIMEFMGNVAGGNLSEDDTDKFFDAFLEFDDRFIAPHVATDPVRAARGYEMLELLMTLSAFGALFEAKIARDTDEERTYRARGSRGGKKNGENLKRKQAEWTGEALLLAKSYIAVKPEYSQAELARLIKDKLGRRAPDNRQIVSVVSNWQKTGQIPMPQKRA